MAYTKGKNGIFRTRPGIGIVECIILMVVLGITIMAILATMGWANRSYAFAKEDLDRRTTIFNWIQAFESFFPPPGYNAPGTVAHALSACIDATNYLGGSWNAANMEATLKGTRLRVRSEPSITNGVLVMELRAYQPGGASAQVTFTKHFNCFSSETVSDDFVAP